MKKTPLKRKKGMRKKSKKLTIPRLRDKVWNVFSRYIRLKDAVDGWVLCVSCGKQIKAVSKERECEAGHYEHGKDKECYFDEDNVHPQCTRCNRFLSGNMRQYTLFMLEQYGEEKVKRLLNSKKVIWKRSELEELYRKYSNLVKGGEK
jgi:hypothetical protein